MTRRLLQTMLETCPKPFLSPTTPLKP
ncbi:hypothetical protein LINPERPRIM_LOCUS5025 [Linum perenne]